MNGKRGPLSRNPSWSVALAILVVLLVVACGTAAQQPAASEAPASEPAAAPAAAAAPAQEIAQPTPVPQAEAAPAPEETTVAKDSITLVMAAEPGSVDPWNPTCNATLDTAVCNEIVNEPMTWITSDTYEVVTLSGVEGWAQVDAKNWDFTLRQGVKFHNGEPWNATTAKAGIDQNGDVNNSSQSYGNHGPITGEVISEYVVRVVCGADCPNLPRGMIFNRFQAPEWYQTVTKDESSRHVYGIGPYRFIEWRPGIDIQMEIYEDYVPNPDTSIVDGQAPHIKYVTNTWRNEPLVRSAMVETGEAEWAADIGFENKGAVPKWQQSGTTEVYALIPDIMWHPELKKKEVREALNLAIDCEAITDALLEGLPCWGNISPSGSAGLTPENTAPYPYDPARAKELLEEAGYDRDNKIIIYSRPGNCCRDLEFQEAVVQYWQDVGVNAEFQLVERTRLKELTSSGCGRFKDDESYIGVWDCAQRDPPGPAFTTSHTNTVATSTEQLDVLVRLYGRMGCLHTSSKACFPEMWEKLQVASQTPIGELREQRSVEIANFVHDEHVFIPLLEVQLVYGMADNLDWEPLYAPRLRANTMRYTQ